MEALSCIEDIEYVISDQAGHCFLERDDTGKYIKGYNIQKAAKFSNEAKAKNVIANSINKLEQKKWIARAINKQEDEIELIEDVTPISVDEIYDYNDDLIDDIKCILELLGNMFDNENTAKLYCKKLSSELTYVELMLCDVYHFIELEKVNAIKRQKVYKALKLLLERRRKIKDNIHLLDTIINNRETVLKFLTCFKKLVNNNRIYGNRTEVYNLLVEL